METGLDEVNYGSQMTEKFTIYNQKPTYLSHSKSNVMKNNDINEVLIWVRNFDMLPHCNSVSCSNQLRNGIGLAEILSTFIMNSQLKSSMLSQIAISNLNTQTQIKNLRTILKTIKLLGFTKYQNYNPEQLVMQKSEHKFDNFLKDFHQFCKVISKKLCQSQTKTNTKQTTAFQSVENHQFAYQGLQQISEIANLSSANICLSQAKQNKSSKKSCGIRIPTSNIILEIQNDLQKQQLIKDQAENQFSYEMISYLSEWAMQEIKTNRQIDQPHQFLALLINSLFSDRLHPQPIIKKTHFKMGSLAVWKKINSFLTTVQRLNKKNVIQLIKSVQQQGIVKQTVFWQVIRDLNQMKKGRMQYRNNIFAQQTNQNAENKQNQSKQNRSVKSMGKKRKSSKNLTTQRTENQRQQYIIINKRPNKQVKLKLPQISQKDIQNAEKWIQQLGFIHSLNVSKKKKQQKRTLKNVLESPLLNGTLIGSILMRLQIGKPNLIKQPTNSKQLQRNLQQLLRISIGRGYSCVRELLRFKGNYNQYLSVILKIKSMFQGEKQQMKEVLNSEHQTRKIDQNQEKKYYNAQKTEVIQWIHKNFEIQFDQKYNMYEKILTCQQLSYICSQLLKLSLYRQTTLKIQLQNLQKILDELRRIGLSQYYTEKAEDYVNQYEGNQKRWRIMLELFQLFNSVF